MAGVALPPAGAHVFEMLSRTHLTRLCPAAAQGLSMLAIAFNVTVQGRHPPLEGLEGAVPARLVRLLRDCFYRDPVRRPEAHEVAKILLLVQEKLHTQGAVVAARAELLRGGGAAAEERL